MPRWISAPTTAACWWRGHRLAASRSSMRSRASFAWEKVWLRAAACRRRRSTGPSTRSRSAPARSRRHHVCTRGSDRYRGLPAGRATRRNSCAACARRPTSTSGSSAARPKPGWPLSGCASLIDASCDLALVFDIGGGSSELIWLDLKAQASDGAAHAYRPPGDAELHRRLDLAAGRGRDPGRALRRQVPSMPMPSTPWSATCSTLLEPFEAEHRLRERLADKQAHLLGTSGTVTTVAGVHLGLPRYERRHGGWLLARGGPRSRRHGGCWPPPTPSAWRSLASARIAADLVLAGCAILEALLQTWPCERLRVADRGLREGILATLMAEDGVYRSRRPIRATGSARQRTI